GMGDPPPQPNVPPPPGNTEAPPAGGFTPPEAPKTGNEKKPISLDENPFAQSENADPRAKSLEAFAAVWERNIGPLSETPEVRKALFDLVGENGLDFDFKDDKGNSLWDLMKNGDGSDFGDLFNGASSGGGSWFGDWDFPKFGDWFGGGGGSSSSSSWNWGRWGSSSSSSSSRSGSGFGSGGGGFGFGGDLPWIPFVVLLVIILAVVIWFQVKNIDIQRSAVVVAGDGLGPWPVDPRQINTREEVVKAFEYLSVLICGPSARNWTHNTIADALSDLATTHGETAVMLARLYELARYAPIDEPLSNAELIEARKLVCSLAGVSY
ncbi:MAG TPA: hypothetical protein VLM40_23530, partial [Gemmata sp.]|nr:hypothetical protein [Gemmata sp.]